MADNMNVTPGTGATVAADDVGGVLYQRVKVAVGADGAASDVSITNPLPVGAKYNSTLPTLTNGDAAALQFSARGSVITTLYLPDVAANVAAQLPNGDAKGVSGASLSVVNFAYNFNGSTWDRQKGDANGVITQPHALSGSRWQYAAGSGGIVDTTDVAVSAAGGASVRNYVTSIQAINTHATVATEVVVKDGSTVVWRAKLPALMTTPMTAQFQTPLKGTANTALNVAAITTGAEVYVNVQGFLGS